MHLVNEVAEPDVFLTDVPPGDPHPILRPRRLFDEGKGFERLDQRLGAVAAFACSLGRAKKLRDQSGSGERDVVFASRAQGNALVLVPAANRS